MTQNGQGDSSRIFTRKDLERFDGREGRPLYIVFKDRVYDLTSSQLWVEGMHMGVHTRDENLADTIKEAPHTEEILERFEQVGHIEEEAPAPAIPTEPKPLQPSTEIPAAAPFNMDRRNFLKLVAAGGGAITILAFTSSIKALTFLPTPTAAQAWPKVVVANVKSLQNLAPVSFNYPLTNTPNILVKLGVAAENGVGPDSDIVAFSGICQHLGCFYGFIPPKASPKCNPKYSAVLPQGYCCCHGSQYDFVHGAQVIGGPAPRPVPQVQLEYDESTGNISAVGMGPPTIYGHGPPGTTDSNLVQMYDLQGGEVVAST